MNKIYYPVFKCKNCGEIIVVEKINVRNYKEMSNVLNSGFFDNQNKPKLHKCKNQFVPEEKYSNFDFHVTLEPIGFMQEREEVKNEIGNGKLDSGDQEGNRETDINKQS